MANNKQMKYSKTDVAIVTALKNYPEGLTLAEIAAKADMNLVSGHIVAAKKKGLVTVIGERDVERKVSSTVCVYKYVTSDVTARANGKTNTYTANEEKVLAAAAAIGAPFTLAELAVAMGKEKMSSGSITGLIKKGNILKTEEMRKVERVTLKPNNVYGLVSDIPADATIA